MIEFKTDRIKQEWSDLDGKNPSLKRLVIVAGEYVSLEFGKSLVLTEIHRTPEETAELYRLTPPEKRPKGAPHEVWHAVDLRSTIYTEDEIKRLLGFLNTFRYVGGKPVSIYHEIRGNAPHFHIQYIGHGS